MMIEKLVKKYNKRTKWNGNLPRKVYCKYCYKNVVPEISDDIVVCSECGYGLKSLDEIEKYDNYNASQFHIEIDFARFCKYYDEVKKNKREANGIDEFGIVPYICSVCKKDQAVIYHGKTQYCNDCDPDKAKKEENLRKWNTPEGKALRKKIDADYKRRQEYAKNHPYKTIKNE